MTDEGQGESQRVVAHRMEMADEALASARAEHAAGRHNFAVNRAYYAAFYGASAALLQRGRHFVKHAGLKTAVHRDLVNAGLLDAEWGRVFDLLFASRQRADYLDFVRYDRETAAQRIADANGFLAEMRRLTEAGQRAKG